MQPVGFYRCWYMSMMWCWCSSLCMYICRRAWSSPFNINDVLDPSSISSNGLDLGCQSLTSEVQLVAKNSIWAFLCTWGKYCTHLMSGLGSGMPKSVTLVTQVTVNFWAHVTRPHKWRTSVDGEENLCEEKITSDWERHVSCVDSFWLLTTSVRVVWKVETRLV